ncbi:MAG: hypothetical protein J0L76_12145 [Rhodobacterales bacterium]|nr:hypothetical protein [Rhodobacterales bacterium]
MDPEFGVGIGQTKASGAVRRPRPTLLVRGMELAGLALVVYGLGDYRFGFVAVGGAMILGSYALYRRKHGPAQPGGENNGPDGSDTDGGGD